MPCFFSSISIRFFFVRVIKACKVVKPDCSSNTFMKMSTSSETTYTGVSSVVYLKNDKETWVDRSTKLSNEAFFSFRGCHYHTV